MWIIFWLQNVYQMNQASIDYHNKCISQTWQCNNNVVFVRFICILCILINYSKVSIGSSALLIDVFHFVLVPAAECHMVWWFSLRSLKAYWWPWVDIFHPGGIFVFLTSSPFPFLLYFMYGNKLIVVHFLYLNESQFMAI